MARSAQCSRAPDVPPDVPESIDLAEFAPFSDRPASPPPAPRVLPADAPLRLDDPRQWWLVITGSVTLFAVAPPRPPATEGTRHFLGTVGTGGLLCGLGEDEFGNAIIAVGMAGTVVNPLDPANPAATPGAKSRLATGCHAWASALAEGLSRPMRPRPAADLAISAGIGPLRAPLGATLAARGAPIWVRLDGGSWFVLGLEPISGFFPLPPEAWLTGGGGTVTPVCAADAVADGAVADGGWAEGLAVLNRAFLEILPAALALNAADELNRLALCAERDAEAEDDARARFAAILRNDRPAAPAGGSDAVADPLLPVFGAVAQYLGLQARRPIRARYSDLDSASTLEELAAASGIRLRPVRLEAGWWRSDLGPLLARRDDGATLALLPSGRGYRVAAADRSSIFAGRLDPKEAARLQPEALCPFVPLPARKLGIVDLLGAGMQRGGGDVSAVLLALLIGAVLGQAVPLGTGLAFSLLIPGGHLSELVQLGLALVLVAAVGWVVGLGAAVARARIEARAGPALHAAIWDRVMRLPLATLTRSSVGEMAGRATAAVNVASGLRALGFVACTAVATILSSTVVMLLAQPTAALVAFGVLVLQLAAANCAGWLQARAFATGEALSGLADAMVFQIVSGLTKLRLAGAEARATAVWAGRFAAMRQRLTAARRVANAYDGFAAGFAILSTAGAFLVIAMMQQVEPGQAAPSLAVVITFVSAYGLMTASAAVLARATLSLWFLAPSVKFARNLMDAVPEASSGRVDPGRLIGTVEVANVVFRYAGAEAPVFAGLSLKVRAGEFIAITGRSGAGKTTLVRLLLGMEEPNGGAIYLDGQDLRGLDTGAVRRQVATVLQSGRVAPGSLRDAVRGLLPADDAAVWAALEAAALAADVRAMPMGLETNLTDANRVLSGGQVQRLLLARALLQKPAIVILDEATSALDNLTQAATMRAVRTMACTRIVIAHRLSTIRHADRIVVLDGGRVGEAGTFDELISRKKGLFARQYAGEARWIAGVGR